MTEFGALPWQDGQWLRVDAMEEGGRLPHALLLRGPEGVGKRRFARRLAARLLCETDVGRPCGNCRSCRLYVSGAHPDLNVLEPEPDRRTISVDSVRRLIASLALTNRYAPCKVILIPAAEVMTVQAANTLLKTLEEPPGASVFILVADRHGLLPATVRSRCQFLDFQPPAPAMSSAWLAAELGTKADVGELLRHARGAPLRAFRAFHEDQTGTFRQVSELLLTLVDGRGDPLEVAEKWRKKGLEIVVSGLISCVGDMIRLKMGVTPVVLAGQDTDTFQALAVRLDSLALWRLLDRCLEARRAVIGRSSLNELLLLEDLACTWSALSNEATA